MTTADRVLAVVFAVWFPLMPGQAPLDFMEDADRPDLG